MGVANKHWRGFKYQQAVGRLFGTQEYLHDERLWRQWKKCACCSKNSQEALSGLILAFYCVQYPRTMSYLKNKIPFSLLKPLKQHVA